MVRALMCIKLILNTVNINFVTFSDFFDSRQLKGEIFSILGYSPRKVRNSAYFDQFKVKNGVAPSAKLG
ncbi:hypothetical protein ACOSP7_013786 [Xanthoceras sorbifolium]